MVQAEISSESAPALNCTTGWVDRITTAEALVPECDTSCGELIRPSKRLPKTIEYYLPESFAEVARTMMMELWLEDLDWVDNASSSSSKNKREQHHEDASENDGTLGRGSRSFNQPDSPLELLRENNSKDSVSFLFASIITERITMIGILKMHYETIKFLF